MDAAAITQGLKDFYVQYLVTAADQSIQVFQSYTYGEMTIAALLLTLLVAFLGKWFWEVMR
jgi:hypothetical protein